MLAKIKMDWFSGQQLHLYINQPLGGQENSTPLLYNML